MHWNRRSVLSLLGLGLLSLLGFKFFKMPPGRSSQPSDRRLAQMPPAPPVVRTTAAQPRLRFVAVADTGTGDRNQTDVAAVMSRYYAQNPYALVILAGDNIYTNGEIGKIGAVFEQPYAALLRQGVVFRACLGNHDIRTDNGDSQIRYANFHMPARYYTFRANSVQFFALDTNHNANWGAQIAWLERELAQSDAPWKIVFGHHPLYSSGHYGNDHALIAALTPLFKKYGVQLYLNGHEHSYERTKALDGTTYLITGIGGAQLRPVGQSEWTEFAVSRYGFSALEVFDDRIEIQAIGTDGLVFDRGTIAQTSTPLAPVPT
jgi:acid phosphatase